MASKSEQGGQAQVRRVIPDRDAAGERVDFDRKDMWGGG